MPDELDIVRMERRRTIFAETTRKLVHVAFLHHAADDIGACLAEIHRLRALVATEQAKTESLQWVLRIESDDHRWNRVVSGSEPNILESWQCLLCGEMSPAKRWPESTIPPAGQVCPWAG